MGLRPQCLPFLCCLTASLLLPGLIRSKCLHKVEELHWGVIRELHAPKQLWRECTPTAGRAPRVQFLLWIRQRLGLNLRFSSKCKSRNNSRSPSPSLSPVLWMVPAFLQIWTWYWFKKLLKIKPIIFIWNKFFTVGEMKSFQFIRYSDHLQFPNPVCWGKLESWLDLNVLSLSWQPGFLFCLCMVCV